MTLRLLWVLLVLSGCAASESDPERALRDLIERAETAAEQRDAAALKGLIDERYQDGRGWSRRQVAAVIHSVLLRRRQVNLFTVIREIEIIEPTQARALVLVAMAGRPVARREQLADLRAELWRFEVWFKVRDDEWRVVRADWQPASLDEFLF